MGIIEEFKSKNFTIYAQWAGLLSIPLLVLSGIISILRVYPSIIAWFMAFILIFVEVPFCMKICPTSPKFDSFIKKFENNYVRTIGYLIFSIVILILVHKDWIYILPGISLLITGICYGIAAMKHQNHMSSTITGGSGVSNV